jgi:hypothetical protein
MRQASGMEFLVVAFILVVGPLAARFGADSRLDESSRRRRWEGIF